MLFTPSFFFALLRCAFPLPYGHRTEFTEGLHGICGSVKFNVYNVTVHSGKA